MYICIYMYAVIQNWLLAFARSLRFTHPFLHALTHPLTHSLTHSRAHTRYQYSNEVDCKPVMDFTHHVGYSCRALQFSRNGTSKFDTFICNYMYCTCTFNISFKRNIPYPYAVLFVCFCSIFMYPCMQNCQKAAIA